MIKVMEGVRVLEVAQFTFVPAAGAILADWGADVIKIEHPVRGDTQRGFINMGGFKLNPERHPLIEHPNRGKRSVGIDVSTPGGQEVLYETRQDRRRLPDQLPARSAARRTSSTSSTSARSTRTSSMRAAAPTATRDREREIGGFDGTAFWTRSGIGHAMTPEELGGAAVPGHPGVRRLHRRDEHRRRHLRGAVPPRAHRRGRRNSTSRC